MDLSWEAVDEGWSVLLCMRCRLPLGVLAHAPGSSPDWEAHLLEVVREARAHQCHGWKERHEST